MSSSRKRHHQFFIILARICLAFRTQRKRGSPRSKTIPTTFFKTAVRSFSLMSFWGKKKKKTHMTFVWAIFICWLSFSICLLKGHLLLDRIGKSHHIVDKWLINPYRRFSGCFLFAIWQEVCTQVLCLTLIWFCVPVVLMKAHGSGVCTVHTSLTITDKQQIQNKCIPDLAKITHYSTPLHSIFNDLQKWSSQNLKLEKDWTMHGASNCEQYLK